MEGWFEDALCRGKHQDLWFPPLDAEERTAPESEYYAIAKMVCEHCPHRSECNRIGASEEWGVWGMSDPKDRRRGGEPAKPDRVLMARYIDRVIPEHSGVRLDVPAVRAAIRGYSDKR